MPSKLEEIEQQQRSFFEFILGKPEDIDKPFKWYNYLFVAMKLITPIAVIVLFLYKQYDWATIFLIAFICDVAAMIYLNKRYKAMVEMNELWDLAKKPRGKHE